MRFFYILFLAVALVTVLGVAPIDKGNEVNCSCAWFGKKGNDKISGTPLLTKVVKIKAKCDEDGAKECGEFCKEFGEIFFAKENQDLCRALRDTDDPLRPSMYSKICDGKVWTYTGLTAYRDYCCVEGKHDICQFK